MQGTEFVNEFLRIKFHRSLVDHKNLKKLYSSKIYMYTVNGYEVRLCNKICICKWLAAYCSSVIHCLKTLFHLTILHPSSPTILSIHPSIHPSSPSYQLTFPSYMIKVSWSWNLQGVRKNQLWNVPCTLLPAVQWIYSSKLIMKVSRINEKLISTLVQSNL